jgi:hypothetical protein
MASSPCSVLCIGLIPFGCCWTLTKIANVKRMKWLLYSYNVCSLVLRALGLFVVLLCSYTVWFTTALPFGLQHYVPPR